MNKYISINVKKIIKENYEVYNFDDFKILGDNENFVFYLNNIIFRLTKFTHRSKKELETETKLLNILYDNGASVVKIIPSIKGNYFVQIKGDNLFITAFENADGEIIDIELLVNKNEVIQEWGSTMGKIHKLTSLNISKLDSGNRLEWYDQIIIKNADRLLPDSDAFILGILKNLIDSFNILEINNNDYGLVHTDMRPRNFHYSNGKIIHFDFDDITNNWFIFDLAVSIFHETERFETKIERTIFMKNFILYFLNGYLKEKDIKYIYLEQIINFMHVRLIFAYIDYYRRLKIKGVDSGKEKMLERRKFIKSFEDFINIKEIENLIYSFKN